VAKFRKENWLRNNVRQAKTARRRSGAGFCAAGNQTSAHLAAPQLIKNGKHAAYGKIAGADNGATLGKEPASQDAAPGREIRLFLLRKRREKSIISA
jgi:hypothetical protein